MYFLDELEESEKLSALRRQENSSKDREKRKGSKFCATDDFLAGHRMLQDLIHDYKEAEEQFCYVFHDASTENKLDSEFVENGEAVQSDPSSSPWSQTVSKIIIADLSQPQDEERNKVSACDAKDLQNGNESNTCQTDKQTIYQSRKRNEVDSNVRMKRVPSSATKLKKNIPLQESNRGKAISKCKSAGMTVRTKKKETQRTNSRKRITRPRQQKASATNLSTCKTDRNMRSKYLCTDNDVSTDKSKGRSEETSMKIEDKCNLQAAVNITIQRTYNPLSPIAEQSGHSSDEGCQQSRALSSRKEVDSSIDDEKRSSGNANDENINTEVGHRTSGSDALTSSVLKRFAKVDTDLCSSRAVVEVEEILPLQRNETARHVPHSCVEENFVDQEYPSLFDFYIKGTGYVEINDYAKLKDVPFMKQQSSRSVSVRGQNEEENTSFGLPLQGEISQDSLEKVTAKTSQLDIGNSDEHNIIKLLPTNSSDISETSNVKSATTCSSSEQRNHQLLTSSDAEKESLNVRCQLEHGIRVSCPVSEGGELSSVTSGTARYPDDESDGRAIPNIKLNTEALSDGKHSQVYQQVSEESAESTVSNDPYKDMARIAFDPLLVNSALCLSPSKESELSRSKKWSVISGASSRRSSQESSFRRSSVSTQTSDGSESGDEDVIEWTKGNMIGKGAYGTVYLGLTSKGRMTAVKQVELNDADRREAQKVRLLF